MSAQTYTPPSITSYGRVGEVTLSDQALFGMKLAAAFVASVVNQPGAAPGGQEVVNTPPPGPTETGGPPVTGGPVDAPGAPGGGGDQPVMVPTGGGGTEGVNATGGGGGSAGSTGTADGRELPFTGMAVALTAGVGVALAGAGAKLRTLAGRRAGDDA